MDKQTCKSFFSGEVEAEITYDESNIFDEVYNLELTKDYIKYVEERLTAVFKRKGCLDRYDLWSALGMDLSKIGPIENDYILVKDLGER